MNKAFLPLSREFFKHEYYRAEKFDRLHAYLDLIFLAEFKDESFPMIVKGKELKIKRGQVANSELALGDRWKWNVKTVVKYLKFLKRNGELSYEPFPKRNPGLTIFTLHNYDQICPKYAAQQPVLTELPSIIPSDFPSEIPSEIPDEIPNGIPTSNNITSQTSSTSETVITNTKKLNTKEEPINNIESGLSYRIRSALEIDRSMNGSL